MCIWKICTIYHALHTYNTNFVILFCLHVKRAPGWVWMFREHWKWACWPMNVNVSPSFAAVLHRFTLYGNMQQLRALRPEWRRTVIWTFQNLWRFVLVDDTRLFPVSASSEVKEMFLLSWFHFDNFPEDVLLEHVNTAFLFFLTLSPSARSAQVLENRARIFLHLRWAVGHSTFSFWLEACGCLSVILSVLQSK